MSVRSFFDLNVLVYTDDADADAMIVQMALVADCALLYSEDLQDGRRFAGLRIVNPFRQESGAEPAGH
jgi:hypothetical protein